MELTKYHNNFYSNQINKNIKITLTEIKVIRYALSRRQKLFYVSNFSYEKNCD